MNFYLFLTYFLIAKIKLNNNINDKGLNNKENTS